MCVFHKSYMKISSTIPATFYVEVLLDNIELIVDHENWGRPVFADLVEFVEEVLHTAKQYMVDNSKELNIRVCGLYLLYGLYFKQPTNLFCKIRMTYENWKAFNRLINELRHGNHLDGLFIACKLQVSGAFIHVVTERTYGLEKTYRKYHMYTVDSLEIDESSMNEEFKTVIIKSGLLKSLELINEKYYQAKCVLPGGSGVAPEKSLTLVNKDLASVLQTQCEAIMKINPINDMLSNIVDDNIGTRRERLKKQQFESQFISKFNDNQTVDLFKKKTIKKKCKIK